MAAVTIGIIGANGQVGSEVALLLSLVQGVRVIPICRSERASAFLRHCGMEVRHGSMENEGDASRLLQDCNLVADFSLPKGDPSEARRRVGRIIRNACHYLPRGGHFVYISSLMALGMPDTSPVIRRYLVSRTVYGCAKRYAESVAVSWSRTHKARCFILRLGEVHGEFQRVSQSLLANLRTGQVDVPAGESYTVFTTYVAKALVAVASGSEEEGCYSVVTNPALTWKELFELYLAKMGIAPEIQESVLPTQPGAVSRFGRELIGGLFRPIINLGIKHRQIVAGYGTVHFPGAENRLGGLYLLHQASSEIEKSLESARYQPHNTIGGKTPGRRLRMGESAEERRSAYVGLRKILYDADERLRLIGKCKSHETAADTKGML